MWKAEVTSDGFWRVVEDDYLVIARECVEQDAKLIAAAPDLLHVAKVFKMTCEDRLSLLRNDEKDWRPDDEWRDMIGHYTAILGDCNRGIAKAEGR